MCLYAKQDKIAILLLCVAVFFVGFLMGMLVLIPKVTDTDKALQVYIEKCL